VSFLQQTVMLTEDNTASQELGGKLLWVVSFVDLNFVSIQFVNESDQLIGLKKVHERKKLGRNKTFAPEHPPVQMRE
jgi:hypothetical protein